MNYPKLFRLRQSFDGPTIDDVSAEVQIQLATLELQTEVRPGQRVAITAGSRGIANIHLITRSVVEFVRQLGARPYIVPAMGSHGGATADGQRKVLKSLGITEAFCDCEIRASMETDVVCQSAEGFDVHFDRHAYEADHVIVCGRVKAHTDFNGAIQSGLMKMMLIGLGKHRGACIYHRAFKEFSFDQIVRSVSATVIQECSILAGLAVVENGYEKTALLEAVHPANIETREPELLQRSLDWMARLPFDAIDVLIVDEIGKNISGTGMDTNVVGRKSNENKAVNGETPNIKKIVVRGLSEKTDGNATGIGVADYTTQGVVDSINYEATRVNCVTSGRTAVGMLPIHFPTERETIEAALNTVGLTPSENARVCWIRNTLELEEMECSESLLAEVQSRREFEVLSGLRKMEFDTAGNLVNPNR